MANDGLASCFHDSGANEEALGSEVSITHPFFVLLQITKLSLHWFTDLWIFRKMALGLE